MVNFKATKANSPIATPRKILTFIDCLLNHPKSTLTGELLFLPMVSLLSPHLLDLQREREKEKQPNAETREEEKYYYLYMKKVRVVEIQGKEEEGSLERADFERHEEGMQLLRTLLRGIYVVSIMRTNQVITFLTNQFLKVNFDRQIMFRFARILRWFCLP